jgi:hypothetical protein
VQSYSTYQSGDIFPSFVPNLCFNGGTWVEKQVQNVANLAFLMHESDWPEQAAHLKALYSKYFFCNNDLWRTMLPINLGTCPLALCQVRASKVKFNSNYCLQKSMFLKWCILSSYLYHFIYILSWHLLVIMIFVVSKLRNGLTYLQNFPTKPIFLESSSP